MKKIDFSKTKFRCHALGTLMTGQFGLTEKQQEKFNALTLRKAAFYGGDAKSKLTDIMEADLKELTIKKDQKELSTTTKSKLIEIYNEIRFGRRKELKSKYIKKGLEVEEDCRTLLTRIEFQKSLIVFKKNEERISNAWISGEYDTYIGESVKNADEVIDFKAKWDLFSFSKVFDEPLNSDYEWQMLGYTWLSGAKKARVSNCLVDTPSPLVNDEKRRLLYEMGAISDENEEYLEACAKIDHEHCFDDIPLIEREFSIYVERDESKIKALKERIPLWRAFLVEYHIKRLNYGKTRKWESLELITEKLG